MSVFQYVTRSISRLGRAVATLLLVAIPGMVSPQATAAQSQKITFNDAVQIAMERSVAIRQSENNLDLQAVTVQSERADFLPNLNLNSGANRRFGLSFDQTVGRLRNQSTDGFNMGANSSLNLFNGFADVATLAQAQHTLAGQEFQNERTRQTVVFNVIQNFLNVILAEERIRIRQEDVDAQQQVLDRIVEFVRVGARAISDQYTQEATLANSQALLLDAESLFQVSKTRLIQTMQLDPLGEYDFVAPNPDEIPLTPQLYNGDDLMRSAFQSRADLRSQEETIEASQQGIRVAQAGYLPKLSFSGSYGTSYSSSSTTVFGDQLDKNQSKSLGFSLQIPLFNRLSVKTNIERSRVQYENAKLDLENLQQAVALDVRQAYYDYQTAVKRLDVTEKLLKSADQALEVEQERYNVGASTLVELTQARSSFVNAASQRAQAIFQFHFQQRLLEYYQGTLDPSKPLFN